MTMTPPALLQKHLWLFTRITWAKEYTQTEDMGHMVQAEIETRGQEYVVCLLE